MAKFGTFKNGYLEIAGINLSDHCESFQPNESIAELPAHAMSDTTVYNAPGLFSWGLQASFFQDFASANVDQTLSPLYANKTVHTVRFRADSAAVSATNPMWSGQAFIASYQPLGGAHGAMLMAPVTWSPASALTRTTT